MSMFIRQTKTNNAATGESYVTHRLVRGERIGGKVRQITVLPLGRHFPFKQEEWPLLCQRIEQITRGQTSLLQSPCPDHIERAAQRYGAAILARAPAIGLPQAVQTCSGQARASTLNSVSLQTNAGVHPRGGYRAASQPAARAARGPAAGTHESAAARVAMPWRWRWTSTA